MTGGADTGTVTRLLESGGGTPPAKPSLLRRSLPLLLPPAKALIEVVGHVPRPLGHAIAALASRPLRRITWNRCRSNIDLFFAPLDWSAADRERLFREHQRYMVRLRLEAARLLAGPAGEVARVATLEGEEHLSAALSGGRGALLVGIHEATWWHAAALLAHRGFDLRAVFNSFPLPSIDDYLVRRARLHGIHLSLVDRGAASQFRACVRDNAVSYIAFDVAVRPETAVRLPFGPTLLPIERGPAILALRLRMPVLRVECEHLPRGRSLVRLLPPAAAARAGPGGVAETCRAWVSALEARVRANPVSWWPWGFAELEPRPEAAPEAVEKGAGGAGGRGPAGGAA